MKDYHPLIDGPAESYAHTIDGDGNPLPAPATGSALVDAMMVRLNRQELEYHMHEEKNAFLTEEQLETMNAALGLEKGPYYRPYCLRCDLGPRVALRSFGFECWNCGNKFGFDLRPIAGNVSNSIIAKTELALTGSPTGKKF